MNTTEIRYQRRRLADVTAALRLARAQMSHEHGPRAELVRHQQRRLEVVVRHAAAHSPFYRRQFVETGTLGDGPVQPSRLPVLDKSLLMEHFDELVCDPRLRRDELLDCEQHAGRLRVSPRILVTVAELRTPEMTHRLEGAFGLHPFRCISRCSPATRRSANSRSSRRAGCCAYSSFPGIHPARPRQAPTTDSRRVSVTPLPSNSSDSACRTRRSRSNVVASWPVRPAASSSS